jgi:molybdopterin synthase catalytic subunit
MQVEIVDGAVGPARPPDVPGAGAILMFEGIVREAEPSAEDPRATIEALDYQTYEPMAQSMIVKIGDELIAKHGLMGMFVIHSRGRVAVGECSFRLVVAAKHRKEALRAMDEFIDLLKKDVPIWKKAVWRQG